MSDFLAHSLKSIVQFLVPELKSLFDSTMNEFDSFKDIKKLFSDGKKLPNNSILEAAKNFIPFELVKEFLTRDGEKLFKYPLPQVIARMKSIAGSVIGGTKDIREMLDFCAKERVYPNIEVIPIQYINEALERMINKDVKYRFVIDIENSLVSN